MISFSSKKVATIGTIIGIVTGIVIGISFLVIISYNYYEENRVRSLYIPIGFPEIVEITLEDYIADKEVYQIIDVREIEEYEQGHFIDAIHIPLGELLASQDKKDELRVLLETKELVFFCYDGIRSQIAADAVGTQDDRIALFHKGHRQVRKNEIAKEVWTGSRTRVLPEDFHNALKAREYDLDEIPPGVVIADVTWDQVYLAENTDVIAVPLMRLTQEEIEKIVNDIAPRSFITVCNSRMSCFYAKVLGYRVEQKGGYFSGYHRIEDAF